MSLVFVAHFKKICANNSVLTTCKKRYWVDYLFFCQLYYVLMCFPTIFECVFDVIFFQSSTYFFIRKSPRITSFFCNAWADCSNGKIHKKPRQDSTIVAGCFVCLPKCQFTALPENPKNFCKEVVEVLQRSWATSSLPEGRVVFSVATNRAVTSAV